MDIFKIRHYNRLNKSMCLKKYNCVFRVMIIEPYKTGHADKEIGREYGISEVTICKRSLCSTITGVYH